MGLTMLSSVFTKTIYEKRWMILGWSGGVIAMSMLMMSFYHSFSGGALDSLVENLPESLRPLVGDVAALRTVPGYVAQQVFALRIPLLTIIMSVVLFSGLLASDEADGTLQNLLTRPISRWSLLLQKFLAGSVACLLICLSSVIGVLVGLLFIGEAMSIWSLLQAALGTWLVSMVFGSFGFLIGAVRGHRGSAGSIAGVVAFTSYLLTSFAPSVTAIRSIERLSAFRYYNQPTIAEHGLSPSNALVMFLTTAFFLTAAGYLFNKRDIFSH
jgi:ABC-2 type transport system permease protein